MKNCDVVKDLIPLYIDDVASTGSRTMVDEHIQNCADCAEELAKLKENGETAVPGMDDVEISAFKKTKRKFAKKTLVTTFSAVLVVLILFWAVDVWRIPVPFDADHIVVHPPNSVQSFTMSAYTYIEGTESSRAENDLCWLIVGPRPTLDIRNHYSYVTMMQIGDELFISFTNTLPVHFFKKSGSGEWHIHTDRPSSFSLTLIGLPDDDNRLYAIEDAISKIYYMNANYQRLYELSTDDSAHEKAKAALEKAKKDAVLVWER